MRRRLSHLVIFAVIAAAYTFGLIAPIDRLITDLRFRLTERPASGSVVIVEIDAKSVRELEVWPWPRSRHAALLDRLVEAGARAIAFDIDFSSRSTAEHDRAFAAALARAGGRVALPILKQAEHAENGSSELVVSLPIPEFRPYVEPAHVNVRIGPDNLVRHYLAHEPFGDIEVPGLATRLAGKSAPRSRIIMIDYSIQPDSVPLLSYVDVLEGRFDSRAVADKNVIIGATAVELGDRLPTPVHGFIVGSMVQALAYETMVQGRVIAPMAGWPVVLAMLVLATVLGPCLSAWSWRQGLAASVACCAVFVALSTVAQGELLLAVDVGPSIVMVLASYGYGMVRRIDHQAASIYRERMVSLHRRAMMSTVVESSFDGIVITDRDGLIQMSNAAANDMMCWDASGIGGRQVDDYIGRPELDRDGPESSEYEWVRPREVEARRGDGSSFTIELVVNTSRMSMATGRVRSRRTDEIVKIFTFRDVTERRRTEQARQRAMEEAVAANRAKTEFLANMSHELRTPLNAVIGFSDIMRTEALGPLGVPEYAEFAGDIHDSGQHLLEIINDILNMSKIEMGNLELDEERVDLPDLIDSCMRLTQSRADEGGVNVSADLKTVPPALIADERLVKQMLLNLLSNAIKFTPIGGSIVVRTLSRDDGALLVQIQDTGIGIDPNDMERVLAPFGQVDGSLQREAEGTGLGLPLVKSMIEAHGGELLIESTPDKGTTVSLVFPPERVSTTIEQAPTGAMEENNAPGPNDPDLISGLSENRTCEETETSFASDADVDGGLRVLVAEDNRVNQVLIQSILAVGGNKVDLVANGREAVEAVRERTYDVVLMDIHMPEMDGLEATREIRTNVASACNVPIIAVTASAGPDDRARFLEAGMNDHVAKPIDTRDLHRAMARQCGLASPEEGQAADEPTTTSKTGKSPTEMDVEHLDELNLLLDATLK